MFDLFRSRETAVRYLLGGVLGIVALSMVITLVPGWGTQSSSASEPVLATVGGEKVTVRDVQLRLQQLMRNRQIPPEVVQMYLPQLIDSIVADRAVAYEAKRLGFHVDDQETANAIRSVLTQLFPNGQFDKAVYERFLADQGLTVQDFENNVRDQVLISRLRNIPLEGIVVTPEEIKQEYHRRNDKIKVQYVSFDPSKFKSDVKVTDQDANVYWANNRQQFRTPEKKSFDLLIGDEQKLAASIDVPEAQLRSAYNANLDRFRVPERVKVRHILVKTMDKSKEDQAKAEAKANDLLKQIKGGADFAELAKKNSDDPGSAQNGGDLGFVVRGQTVKDFENAAFSLPLNQVSNPIKTEYGYHILRVEGKETGRVKPFDEVKNDLATEMKKQTVQDKLQSSVDQARAELAKNPAAGRQIADKYNLLYVHADNVGPGDSIQDVGKSPELDTAVSTLKPKEVSNVFQLGPTRLAVAEVTAVTPSRLSEFAEVSDQIKKVLADQKASQIAQQKLADSVTKFTAPNADFAAIAKSQGLDVKSSDFFTRDGAAEGIGQASYLQDGFVKPVGSVLGPINIPDNANNTTKTVIAKVIDKQVSDETGMAAVRDDIQLTLKRKKANERKDLFEDGLITRLVKEGKIKKFPENIKRLEQSYRS